MLIEGTSHTLKIPIQVARKLATQQNAKEIEAVLMLARGFVDVGAYIQTYRREEREGKIGTRSRLEWVPAVTEDDGLVTLTSDRIWSWMRLALTYVSIGRPDDDAGAVAEILSNTVEWGRRVTVRFGSTSPLPPLNLRGNSIIHWDQSAAAVFTAAFLELAANAIAYSDPDDPIVTVECDIVQSQRKESKLCINVENSVRSGAKCWRTRRDYQDYLRTRTGIVGLRTVDWALAALMWEQLDPSCDEREGRMFQRMTIRAPFKAE